MPYARAGACGRTRVGVAAVDAVVAQLTMAAPKPPKRLLGASGVATDVVVAALEDVGIAAGATPRLEVDLGDCKQNNSWYAVDALRFLESVQTRKLESREDLNSATKAFLAELRSILRRDVASSASGIEDGMQMSLHRFMVHMLDGVGITGLTLAVHEAHDVSRDACTPAQWSRRYAGSRALDELLVKNGLLMPAAKAFGPSLASNPFCSASIADCFIITTPTPITNEPQRVADEIMVDAPIESIRKKADEWVKMATAVLHGANPSHHASLCGIVVGTSSLPRKLAGSRYLSSTKQRAEHTYCMAVEWLSSRWYVEHTAVVSAYLVERRLAKAQADATLTCVPLWASATRALLINAVFAALHVSSPPPAPAVVADFAVRLVRRFSSIATSADAVGRCFIIPVWMPKHVAYMLVQWRGGQPAAAEGDAQMRLVWVNAGSGCVEPSITPASLLDNEAKLAYPADFPFKLVAAVLTDWVDVAETSAMLPRLTATLTHLLTISRNPRAPVESFNVTALVPLPAITTPLLPFDHSDDTFIPRQCVDNCSFWNLFQALRIGLGLKHDNAQWLRFQMAVMTEAVQQRFSDPVTAELDLLPPGPAMGIAGGAVAGASAAAVGGAGAV